MLRSSLLVSDTCTTLHSLPPRLHRSSNSDSSSLGGLPLNHSEYNPEVFRMSVVTISQSLLMLALIVAKSLARAAWPMAAAVMGCASSRAAAAVAAETTVQTACTAASLSRSQHCHRAFDPCGNQLRSPASSTGTVLGQGTAAIALP